MHARQGPTQPRHAANNRGHARRCVRTYRTSAHARPVAGGGRFAGPLVD